MKKSKTNSIKYSPGERRVLGLLSAKRISSTDIIKKVYGTEPPYHGRKIIVGILASLRRKMALNREKFRLASTVRRGPHAMEYWLEKQRGRNHRINGHGGR